MTRLFSLILIGISLFSLSACGTFLDRRAPENVSLGDRSDGLVMPPTQGNGNIYAPSPDAVNVMDYEWNGSVGIATNQNAPAMPMAMGQTPMMQQNSMANIGMASGDSSVTIFPVDGSPSSYNDMLMQNYGGAPSYNAPMTTAYGSGGNNQIYFKYGSSRLGSGDMRKLTTLAQDAKFAPVNRITVEGYASQSSQAGNQTVESHILNLKESMNRSFAVSKTLMQQGVPAEKLKTVSWGSTKATGNETQDRRVDISMGER